MAMEASIEKIGDVLDNVRREVRDCQEDQKFCCYERCTGLVKGVFCT